MGRRVPKATDIYRLVGSVIADKYRIDEVVDRGGFSVVYRGYHLALRQPIALKCFVNLAAGNDEGRDELLDRFAREGALLTALSSRTAAIVQARDLGTLTNEHHASVPYLVLEWLDGRSLEHALHKLGGAAPRLSIEATFHLFDGVCRALAMAHSVGVAHRDIKPANIFVLGGELTPAATLKLLDFGIAKVMDPSAPEMTATVGGVFSPQYAAPEQYNRGLGATGPWTDVYAICLVLLELMRGGQRVYNQKEIQAIAIACLDPVIRPTPRALGIEVSDAVEAVFARATAIVPGERFPDLSAFWNALGEALGVKNMAPMATLSAASLNLPGSNERPGASLVAAAASVSATHSGASREVAFTTSSKPPEPPPRSRAAPLAVGAVASLGLLGTGAWVLSRPAAAPPETPAAVARPAPAGAETPVETPAAPCPEGMTLIKGSKFFMGSDNVDKDALSTARPAHQVELRDFCMDLHEVTVAQYRTCSDPGECKRAHRDAFWPQGSAKKDAWDRSRAAFSELCNEGVEGREQHPVNCITWEQADHFCRHRGARLPSEAEWEYAARSSDGRVFPWGDDPPNPGFLNGCGTECSSWAADHGLPAVPALYAEDDGHPGTAPVGSHPKGRTQTGLFDMVGNVWEWTADTWTAYPGGVPGKIPPHFRVMRGGGFNSSYAVHAEPALRYAQDPTAHVHAVGFRCARDTGQK